MSFEVFVTADGEAKWRLHDSDGQIVRVNPGRVRLPADAAETRRAKAAAHRVLTDMAGKSSGKRKA